MQGEFLLVSFSCVSVLLSVCEIGPVQLREGEIRHRAVRKNLYRKRILRATIIISALAYSIPYPIFIRLIKSMSM